jgi:hypothetical protein
LRIAPAAQVKLQECKRCGLPFVEAETLRHSTKEGIYSALQ